MIIHVSINDNDFADILGGYMANLFTNLTEDLARLCEGTEVSHNNFYNLFSASKRITAIWNENNNGNRDLTEDDKEFLKNRIKISFDDYCRRTGRTQGTIDYLMKNLTINFPDCLYDKWENGEAFYYLSHSNTVVNQ